MNLFNYETFAEFSKKLKSSNLELIEFIIMREIKMFGVSKKQIYSRLSEYIDIMKQSILNGLKTNKELICLTNDAIRLQKNKKKFLATLEYKILTSAISVAFYNCSMGKIVACPTAGSCGILPGALIPISEKYKLSKNKLINALILAGEIGRIMANQTSISGAVGGCMAECGVASAMTASAIVYCFNGNLESILTAAALSLKNNLGLICDP
ncbi:MAG TPA: L-serine ammonia-lyase, iron-sulfur-dependent, subunit alpha, partial [bacterium]|nr:L-serine ammonia-lyase, iron-sulfur-dependent, subunit alpha [bacterium]